MLSVMTYPGDTSLSDDIKERIRTTFRQALDLTEAGSHKEALLGCDFVLRLDPLFEPARILHKRLRASEGAVETTDLRSALGGDTDASLGLDAIESAASDLELAEPIQPAPVAQARAEPAEAPSFEPAVEEALAEPPAPSPPSEVDSELVTTFADEKVDEPDPLLAALTSEPEAPSVDASEIAANEIHLGEAPQSTAQPTAPIDEVQLSELRLSEVPLDASRAGSAVGAPGSAALGGDAITTGGDLSTEMVEPLGEVPQLDDESQRRIAELLEEGQVAYDEAEYQSAIDSWSRVFLIDIDHAEANQRIEQARRMAAEAERQVEEVFHEAMSHLDSGDLELSRHALKRVLELQPSHLAAQEYLDRINSGEVMAPEPEMPLEDEAPMTPAGFDLDETFESEEGDEDLFASPDIVPAAAEFEVPETAMPPAPAAKKRPRQTFFLVGSLVLVLVVAGGWFLRDSWDSLFPNSSSAQGAPTPQRIDPIARARKLHEQGKTAIAIAQLRRLPPGDPHYAEGQALVAQWETAETGTDLLGPSAEDIARYDALVARAKAAHTHREFLLTDDLLRRASSYAPLDAETLAIQEDATVALAPLEEQIKVFRSGDWEYALPKLWRMRESDANNADINRLIVDSYYNLGVRDLQRGRPEAALRKFEEALSLRSNDRTLQRLRDFSATYNGRNEDLLYRIFVKYLPFR